MSTRLGRSPAACLADVQNAQQPALVVSKLDSSLIDQSPTASPAERNKKPTAHRNAPWASTLTTRPPRPRPRSGPRRRARKADDDLEHGVTEAADVQDVGRDPAPGSSCTAAGRCRPASGRQSRGRAAEPGSHERLPLGHHGRRALPARTDPALLVAHQHAAGELPVAISACWPSASGSEQFVPPPPILGQPLGQAQDRIARVEPRVVAAVSNGITTLSGLRRRIAAANKRRHVHAPHLARRAAATVARHRRLPSSPTRRARSRPGPATPARCRKRSRPPDAAQP